MMAEGIIDGLIQKWLDGELRPEVIKPGIDRLVTQLQMTDTNTVAAWAANALRAAFALDPIKSPMLAVEAIGKGRLFTDFVRVHLVSEAVRVKGCSRAEARAALTNADIAGKITDAVIVEHARMAGLKPDFAASGFLQWIEDHWVQIVQIVAALLPLLLMFL